MAIDTSAGRAPATAAPSSRLRTTLKLAYCATQAVLPAIAAVYLVSGNRIASEHPLLFSAAAFLACCIALLLQLVVYLHLPESTPAMFLMVLGPPVWLGIQYIGRPFDPGYYLVVSGVNAMLGTSIAFTWFVVVRNYLQHPVTVLRAVRRTGGNRTASTAVIVLLQATLLVAPLVYVIRGFSGYLIAGYLAGPSARWTDMVLTALFVLHFAIQSLVVFDREGIVARRAGVVG